MKHEFKIILNWEDEGIDSDGTPCALPLIYVDGNVVGCIQNLNFAVSSDNIVPSLEITFPNLKNPDIDPAYMTSRGNLIPDVDYYIEQISKIPCAKVILQNIDDGSNVIPIKEISTDGIIEIVPMQRRHQ